MQFTQEKPLSEIIATASGSDDSMEDIKLESLEGYVKAWFQVRLIEMAIDHHRESEDPDFMPSAEGTAIASQLELEYLHRATGVGITFLPGRLARICNEVCTDGGFDFEVKVSTVGKESDLILVPTTR